MLYVVECRSAGGHIGAAMSNMRTCSTVTIASQSPAGKQAAVMLVSRSGLSLTASATRRHSQSRSAAEC
jgi:hypothetical protein